MSRGRRVSLLLWGTALGSVAYGVTSPQLARAADAGASQPPASDQSALSEIVVTAQRRSEREQEVPVTITTVSGLELSNSGIDSVGQLNELVPAFRVDYTAGFAQPSIRGVGTALSGLGGASNVGIYVDGFYNPSPQSTDFTFVNVDNIQVLKGPQGTLFGRNNTAGAVLVTTSEPQVAPTLSIQSSYGNYNTTDNFFYGSVGTGRVAVDLSAQYHFSNGFITDIVNGDDKVGEDQSSTVRAGLKFNVTDDDYLLLHYQHDNVSNPTVVLWNAYPGSQGPETIANVPGNVAGVPVPGTPYGFGRGNVALIPGFRPEFNSRLDVGQLTGKFDVGFADLTTYSQIRSENDFTDIQFANIPIDLLHVDFDRTERIHTEEALLSSKPGGDRWNWVTGFFYFSQTSGNPLWQAPTYSADDLYTAHLKIQSYAGFGDATYRLVDSLYLTGGARYSVETDSQAYWNCTPAGDAVGFCPPPPGLTSGVTNLPDHTWYNLSPRAVLRYKFDEASDVYASYTKGFKAGFLDVSSFNKTPIAPENIQSYEVGYKIAEKGTRFDASAFYYDYKDLQVQYYQNAAAVTTNAAASTIFGAEANLTQRVTNQFTVSAGAAFTHARYNQYPGAPAGVFSYTTGLITNAPPINAAGNTLAHAPEWTGNVSANYVVPVFNGDFAFNANEYFTSRFYFDPSNTHSQAAYGLLNLKASWSMPTSVGRWTFSLWGNNVTNTRYITQVLSGTYETETTWGLPATYGVTVNYKYQ